MPFSTLRRGAAYALALLFTTAAAAQAPLFIENPQASAHDGFGFAVDVDGDVAIIGAPSERTDGVWTGAAYVYRLQTDGTWALEATLLPPDPDPFGSAEFGTDVAISGDVAVVAAPGEWINHGSGDANTRGSTYVFRMQPDSTWAFEAELHEAAFGVLRYGQAVDVQGDLLAVGATEWTVGPSTGNCSNGSSDGRARVDLYRFDGASWAAADSLVQPDSLRGIAYGTAVSLDGGVVAVGAPYWYSPEHCTGIDYNGNGAVEGEERGRVFVFRETDGAWAFEAALEPADLQDLDQLGHDVAVSGDRLVAGAPYRDGVSVRSGAAFSYLYDGAAWVEEAEFVGMDTQDGDYFGFAVALEGDYAVVGAPRSRNGDLNLGATYGFQRVDGAWQEGFRVTYDEYTSPDPIPINFAFGGAVALDASHVFIGAPEFGDYEGPEVAPDIGSAFSYTLSEYFQTGGSPAISFAATASPTTLPASGGTVTFSVTVTNGEDTALPLELWLEATGPANVARRLAGGSVPAGATVARDLRVSVPAAAPDGAYEVTLRLGHGGATYASASFTITKGAAPRGHRPAAGPVLPALFAAEPVDWGAPVALAPAVMPDEMAAYPNPFSDRATFAFAIAEAAEVRLAVYDVLGREVAVLAEGRVEAGTHAVPFDARGLATGTYVYRLTIGDNVRTGRLTLVR